jgi:uncharacterized protein (DUF2249 family)/hemerythrin-like domain-containing protein
MRDNTRVLDVRQLPPIQREAEVFDLFDTLTAGQAFILIAEGNPRTLVSQFQIRYPGAFEWNVLEADPERFRVEILRRSGDGWRTVSDYLESDHRRLDGILPDVDRLVSAGEVARACEQFEEFSCGLNRHIEAEEQILFPSFEQLTGLTSGPTLVMRAEHVEIRRWMGTATAALGAGDVAGYRNAIHQLTRVLVAHNMKEEQILYPMTDRAAGDSRARDALVRQMQAL